MGVQPGSTQTPSPRHNQSVRRVSKILRKGESWTYAGHLSKEFMTILDSDHTLAVA
jgi:hypothetical protein